MTATVFVTGTDTEVGKTVVATAVIRSARAHGLRVAPFKPVASGAIRVDGMLRNEDAMKLLAAAGGHFKYDDVNPFCFEPAIAPHIAAQECGTIIDLERLDAAHARLAQRVDLVVVEGAGGWRVPLTPEATFADWVAAHGWPVVLVVGMRLGCINHAVLSAAAIMTRARLLGWVANHMPPSMDRAVANEMTLRAMINAPQLGTVPTNADHAAVAAALDWSLVAGALPAAAVRPHARA